MADSILQDERKCFFCGRNGFDDPLDCHHVFGASNRNKSEQYGLKVYLCHNSCHIFGRYSVHKCMRKNLELKQYAQGRAMLYYKWSTEDFIREFGKSYL